MKQLLILVSFSLFSLLGCASNNQAESNSDKTDNEDKTVSLIAKDQFIKEVWNYEDSPNEWKFLGKKPVVIDFYADWCGPCKIAGPILEEVAGEYADQITVYKIDTQRERELAGVFGISSIPAFLYIPMEGKPTMTAGIGRTKQQTKEMFVENIEKLLLNNNE